MENLVKCFFPSSKSPKQFEEIDETFLSFIEEAVKSGDSLTEDLIALVQSVLPDHAIEEEGLPDRIINYRESLLGTNQKEEQSAAKVVPVPLHAILFASGESKENERQEDSANSEEEELVDETLEASLDLLRGLCGLKDRSEDDVLTFLMSKIVLGDADDAARWLLDHGFDEAKQLKLANDKKHREQQKADDEAERVARERIVRKFDEKAEPNLDGKHDTIKVSRKAKQLANPTESKVRYLDGKVVATNGAKYIEVQEKEEWDGGSRGRVKTKGKRGTGWAT